MARNVRDYMLPDFPVVKKRLRLQLLRWCQAQIPAIAPLLGQISSFQQHEGKTAILAREDKSSAPIAYEPAHFEFVVTMDEMRVLDLEGLMAKMLKLSTEMAAAQAKLMFTRINEAVESVGNVVHTGGELKQEHFLEMIEKVQTDFDPTTMQPTGQVFVMHPDVAPKIIAKVQQWEKDAAFRAKYEAVMDKKREEWRAREDRRKLVE